MYIPIYTHYIGVCLYPYMGVGVWGGMCKSGREFLKSASGIQNALYIVRGALYMFKKQSFIYLLAMLNIEENMNNNNMNFVEAVIDSIQIWNREDDIETSNNENIDMRAVMYFQHKIMVQPIPEERPEMYDNTY